MTDINSVLEISLIENAIGQCNIKFVNNEIDQS